MRYRLLIIPVLLLVLSACGTFSTRSDTDPRPAEGTEKGRKVVSVAKGLIGTPYRFGGKTPQAGFDCSGMVSYVYDKAIGLTVTGSAATIAKKGQGVSRSGLRPGDLVFFNTRQFSYSHVGIYIGDNSFIHAPSSHGQVRIDKLNNRYYVQRFNGSRKYFD